MENENKKKHSLIYFWIIVGLVIAGLIATLCFIIVLLDTTGFGPFYFIFLFYYVVVWFTQLILVIPLHLYLNNQDKKLTLFPACLTLVTTFTITALVHLSMSNF